MQRVQSDTYFHRFRYDPGLEATKVLRAEGYSLPIYALTASVQRIDFEDLGFNDWIGKPIPMKTLKEKLQRLYQMQSLVHEDESVLDASKRPSIHTMEPITLPVRASGE